VLVELRFHQEPTESPSGTASGLLEAATVPRHRLVAPGDVEDPRPRSITAATNAGAPAPRDPARSTRW
jgi:hypothetical protein